MARLNVNPTRMELTRLKSAYASARRGHKLLKDKRDELMRRLIEMGKEASKLRDNVENRLKKSGEYFKMAVAVMGYEEVKTALLNENKSAEFEEKKIRVTSVSVPEFKAESITLLYSWGYSHTSVQLDTAVKMFADLMGELLLLAQLEKSIELISTELEKTRRRVNALEHIMLPDYLETIRYITMKLEENERASSIRLLKIKDMVIEEAHRGCCH